MDKLKESEKVFLNVLEKSNGAIEIKNEALEALGHINWIQEKWKKATKYFFQLTESDKTNIPFSLDNQYSSRYAKDSLIPSKEGLEKLLLRDEDKILEFKSSMIHPYENRKEHRSDQEQNENKKRVTHSVLKTICAFLNTDGGNLIIGVDDNKNILGIEPDFKHINEQSLDGWKGHLESILRDRIGTEFSNYIHITDEEKNGKTVVIVRVRSSEKPAYLDPNKKKDCAFFKRNNHGTDYCSVKEAIDYLSLHRGMTFVDKLAKAKNKKKQ